MIWSDPYLWVSLVVAGTIVALEYRLWRRLEPKPDEDLRITLSPAVIGPILGVCVTVAAYALGAFEDGTLGPATAIAGCVMLAFGALLTLVGGSRSEAASPPSPADIDPQSFASDILGLPPVEEATPGGAAGVADFGPWGDEPGLAPLEPLDFEDAESLADTPFPRGRPGVALAVVLAVVPGILVPFAITGASAGAHGGPIVGVGVGIGLAALLLGYLGARHLRPKFAGIATLIAIGTLGVALAASGLGLFERVGVAVGLAVTVLLVAWRAPDAPRVAGGSTGGVA